MEGEGEAAADEEDKEVRENLVHSCVSMATTVY